eukprot:111696_1
MARNLYFSFDFLTAVASWIVLQKNTPIAIAHAFIHIPAVLHLLAILPTTLYLHIFEMGELNFNNKPAATIVFYIYGTTLDISTHLLNLYCFIKYDPVKKHHLK